MGSVGDWKLGNCCLQTEIQASDGKTNTILPQEHATFPVCTASFSTANRQQIPAPQESEDPTKLKRPRYSTFLKSAVAGKEGYRRYRGNGKSRRERVKSCEQAHQIPNGHQRKTVYKRKVLSSLTSHGLTYSPTEGKGDLFLTTCTDPLPMESTQSGFTSALPAPLLGHTQPTGNRSCASQVKTHGLNLCVL